MGVYVCTTPILVQKRQNKGKREKKLSFKYERLFSGKISIRHRNILRALKYDYLRRFGHIYFPLAGQSSN